MLDVKEGIEQHPGHFQPKQCYIPYSETLRNSVKYSKNPVNHPFNTVGVNNACIVIVVHLTLAEAKLERGCIGRFPTVS